MATFEAILRSFAAARPHREAEHLWWRADELSLSEAIERACLSTIPGKSRLMRHGHQCRLPGSVIQEATAAILQLESEIAAAADFEELHSTVRVACASVQGTGPLYCYDVAHRIGLHLGIEPEVIYMHTGTREGAKALGIDVKGKKHIRVSELPIELRELSAADAEDVLCIYKSWFSEAIAPPPITRRC